MGIYESLGIKRRINAAACYTALGGSLMSDEVLAAMNDAAKSFISLHELQQKAGEKIEVNAGKLYRVANDDN